MEVIKAKPWYTFGPLKARVEEVSTLDLEQMPCNSPPCTALDTQTREEHTFILVRFTDYTEAVPFTCTALRCCVERTGEAE